MSSFYYFIGSFSIRLRYTTNKLHNCFSKFLNYCLLGNHSQLILYFFAPLFVRRARSSMTTNPWLNAIFHLLKRKLVSRSVLVDRKNQIQKKPYSNKFNSWPAHVIRKRGIPARGKKRHRYFERKDFSKFTEVIFNDTKNSFSIWKHGDR